MQCNISTAD